MIIYRFECIESGYGPHTAPMNKARQENLVLSREFTDAIRFGPVQQPQPETDGIEHSNDYRYGCVSLSALWQWMGREVIANGLMLRFRIAAYVVPDDKVVVGRSGLQVAFNPADAIRVFPVINEKERVA